MLYRYTVLYYEVQTVHEILYNVCTKKIQVCSKPQYFYYGFFKGPTSTSIGEVSQGKSGGKVSKRLGGIKGCKNKDSTYYTF